jgi:very-short-patch-repair endonuclease
VTGVLKDNERLYQAFRNGWPVLRFTPQQVEDGEAREMVREYLEG